MTNMIQTMKRFLYSLCLLWLFATTASAYDFMKDGIYYNILSDSELTCEVTSGSNDYSGSIVIPASVEYDGNIYSVTSIGYKAFSNSAPTSIDIPNSVTSIGGYAFEYCRKLTSINIPNSVTSIEYFAFYYCDALTDLRIENGNNTLTFGGYVFNGTSLTTVYIGRNWDYSSSNSSVYPSNISSVTLSDFVTYIGDGAFSYCSALTAVNIPNSVTNIGDQAFYGCDKLTSIDIPNSVTSIGSKAFYDCTGLHSITIGTGVLSIGANAFSPQKVIWLPNTPPKGYEGNDGTYNYVSNDSYSNLQNVTVYPYLSSLFESDGIKYVPISPSERTCAAIDCAYDGTKEIRLGKTVHYQGIELNLLDIRPALCYDNDSIETLHIEGYAGNIGDYAFYDCEKLSGIALPNTVASLGASCFEGCAALGYAEIGSGIGELPDACFSGCAALTDIEIPATVERIADDVFQGCTSLAYVTLCDRETELALGSNDDEPLFADCPLNTV